MSHPDGLNAFCNNLPVLPDPSHTNYEGILKSVIIEAKMKQLREMPLTQLIRHFGVEIKPHQNSQVVKRLEINDL